MVRGLFAVGSTLQWYFTIPIEGIMLYQYMYLVSPQQAESILYSRFINTSGVPGRNISADLFMEHLNKELKSGIVSGSRKTQKAILRLGRAIGTVHPVLQNFDEVIGINQHNTRHKVAAMKNDLLKVVDHLKQYKVFHSQSGRGFCSFPNPKSLLHKKEEKNILSCIKTLI